MKIALNDFSKNECRKLIIKIMWHYHESQVGPKAGIPRLTIPYIIFSVNFLFEMTQIASG